MTPSAICFADSVPWHGTPGTVFCNALGYPREPAKTRNRHALRSLCESFLWQILLDTSGSMAGSFSGNETFVGSIEPAQDSTRIAAAKRAVLKEIASLPDCLVSVITFADEAQLLCQGSAKHTDLFQSSLLPIIPAGRTNLADAMLLALRQARGFSGSDTAILIISAHATVVSNNFSKDYFIEGTNGDRQRKQPAQQKHDPDGDFRRIVGKRALAQQPDARRERRTTGPGRPFDSARIVALQ
jgi:hypothetical protein